MSHDAERDEGKRATDGHRQPGSLHRNLEGLLRHRASHPRTTGHPVQLTVAPGGGIASQQGRPGPFQSDKAEVECRLPAGDANRWFH